MNIKTKYTNGFFKSFLTMALLGVIVNSSSLASYELIDLGPNVNPKAINNAGIVVGASNTDQNPASAFRWSAGSGIEIIDGTSANALNDDGQMAGSTITGAFMLDANNYRDWSDYGAFGINSSGAVAGYQIGENPYQSVSLPYNPAIYNGSKWEVYDIAKLYSRGTREGVYADRFILNSINTDGYAVGYKYRYGLAGSAAFLIDPNIPVTDAADIVYLPTPAGGKAADINNNNMIVGTTGSNTSTTPITYAQAYSYDYDGDNLTVLPVLSGGNRSNAYDINDYNQIVGSSETLVGSIKADHAVIWHEGGITDLNSLLADGTINAPGWVLQSANAINDNVNPDIVGVGLLNGVPHGFMLTSAAPADQPAPIIDQPDPVVAANEPPVAIASADVVSGKAPLLVNFDSTGSADPDGGNISYLWDFNDGSPATEANPSHEFNLPGTYVVTLTVTDDQGFQASDSVTITVKKSRRKR